MSELNKPNPCFVGFNSSVRKAEKRGNTVNKIKRVNSSVMAGGKSREEK